MISGNGDYLDSLRHALHMRTQILCHKGRSEDPDA